MKKTTKKSAPKVSHKKPIKDLQIKPVKGATVRGGWDVNHNTKV